VRRLEVSCFRGATAFALFFAATSDAAQPALKLTLAHRLEVRMTEIRFVDLQADQPASEIRILISGGRVRQDFGRDDQGFILYDHPARTVWHVSPHDRRLTGVEAGRLGKVWPDDWKIGKEAMPSEQGTLTQFRVNDTLCLEYKSAALLPREATLLAAYRRALAANHAKVWMATPDALRQSCALATDVELAGVEFSQGIPLAVRYWDGRSRVYQGHDKQPLRAELFELPAGYLGSMIRPGFQEKETRRQPAASQTR
jgi:hypothetical protein